MFEVERSIAQVTGKFNAILDYAVEGGRADDAYTAERTLFRDLLALGRLLLGLWFASRRGGDVGEAVATEAGDVLPRRRLKGRGYLSLFGKLPLERWYYHTEGSPSVFPLDEEANLPERRPSYVVQELTGQRVAQMTYDETLAEMDALFGLRLPKHMVQDLVREMARDADPYYQAQGTPPPDTEADVLVAAIDGKGVPMVKARPAEHRTRLRKGQKRSRKKEAVVTTVYTIEPQPRGPEDIVREVRDREPPPRRPTPQNKRLRATLRGKTDAFEWVRREIERRDPGGKKRRVCLMDGSRGLWTVALTVLGALGFTFILDLFHALEYLWRAAYVFHPEGSPEAEAFVRHRLRMLCEGKVGYVIGGLRQMLTKHGDRLRKAQRETLSKVIHYYETNKEWMAYDEYIAAGYPIGSGAVEGACRHLVKDRMEGSGMRWTVEGAEAVLKLRGIYLNGDWDAFWHFHMQREAQRRFGDRRWAPLSAPEAVTAAA